MYNQKLSAGAAILQAQQFRSMEQAQGPSFWKCAFQPILHKVV